MTVTPAADRGTFEQAMRAGRASLERGDLDAASAAFALAVEIDPLAPVPLRRLANLFTQAGRHAEADGALAEALNLEPDSRDIQMALYRSCRLQGEHAAALAYLTILLSRYPHEPALLLEHADTLLDLGLARRAERSCFRVLAADPANGRALLALVRAARMAADPSLLSARIDQALAALPSDQTLLVGRDPIDHATIPEYGTGMRPDLENWPLLDASPESVWGSSEMLAQKIDLLRDAGDYPAILAVVAGNNVSGTHHPVLWRSVARALIRFAKSGEVGAWLADPPLASPVISADLEEFRGTLAESVGLFTSALAHYRRALELDPERRSVDKDIARVSLVELEVDAAHAAYNRHVRYRTEHRKPHEAITHTSQTHFGQLLDEYRLDGETIVALLPLRSLPPADRVASICKVVADNPRSTAAASFLMSSMREAGILGGPSSDMQGDGCEPAIPRRISQFWFQADPPADVASLLRSWQELNPNCIYTLFNDETAQEWLKVHQPLRVLMAYRRAAQIAQKADLFRLALISVEGGVYADADDRCLNPFAELIAGSSFFGYQNQYGMLGNNFMACAPDHPVIRRALVLAVRAMSRGDDELLWLSTGPGLLTRAFAQVAAGTGTGLLAPGETRIVDRRTLGPFVAMHCKVSYKPTSGDHWTL